MAINQISNFSNGINTAASIDVRKSLENFEDILKNFLKNYADLVNNPDPTKELMVGNTAIPGDQIHNSASVLLIEDFLAKQEQAQLTLMGILDKLVKFEDQINSIRV